MTTTLPMISSPALVLSVGNSLVSAVMDVERIFFRSDPRRNSTTRFLTLNLHAKKTELIPACEMEQGRRSGSLTREQIHEQMRDGMEGVKSGIRSALHELRSHERLIEVGLGAKTALPLDVIVVADLAEPESAVLEIILPMIESLLTDEPYAKIHLLLSSAVFSDDPVLTANAGVALGNLQVFLESGEQSNMPQIYLFDRYKEGIWEARDAVELQTILGNFLLALLSGGLAQHLAHQVTQLDVEERRAYFCGASATILIFDVELLQKACAMRLGAEIVTAEFHSKIVPDPMPVEELAAEFALNFANLQAWMNRLFRESIFQPHGETGVDLHFSGLQFEDVPMEDWVKTIQSYETAFKEKQLPAQTDLIQKNASELNSEFLEQLAQFVQSLPQQTRLYPGGVRSAQMVIEQIRKILQRGQSLPGDISAIEQDWNTRIRSSLEALNQTMLLLPKPPRWFFHLPALFRKPVIQLFNLIFLYRDLKTLTDLRQACVRLLEQKYEAWMKESVARHLTDLSANWTTALDKHAKALKRLQSTLDKLQRQFTDRIVQLIASSSLFRLSALDEPVLSWAYYYGKRPQEGFRHTLLTEKGFLNDWHKSNLKTFEERLGDFCQQIYLPLSNTDLEEALHHRDGKDANALAVSMLQGAVPLLRPNFDQAGSGSSFQMRFFQCREPLTSSLYPVFKNDEQDWAVVSTDDPLVAICCRVRMMIPLSSLNYIFERGQITLENNEQT
ncbi:MAG: hypothetical protein HY863_02235 [Chloroflexi bacterium]|nr:hypothetical protein [Chloroflexota bacterium]